MKIIKTVGIIGLGFGVVLAVLFGLGYVLTIGEYTVPETVAQDSSLPSITIDGYTYHAETYGDPANPVVITLHGGSGGDYRSILLPRLQQKYSAFWSSIILGVMWTFWHAPAFWAPQGTAISGQPVTLFAVGWYLIFTIGISILTIFIYHNTRGSVLLAVLFHGMYTGSSVFPLFQDISSTALNQVIKLTIIPVWILVVLIIARFGAAHLSRNNERFILKQRLDVLPIGKKF